jgi:hypothetical protein
MSASGMGQGVEDSAMSVWTMPSGAMVQSHESFTHPFAGSGLEVHGTEGLDLRQRGDDAAPVGEIELVTAAGREAVAFPTATDLYTRSCRISAGRRGQGRPAATGEDGVKSLAVALAVREAARSPASARPYDYPETLTDEQARHPAAEAVAAHPDGAVVTVSSSGAWLPRSVLKALGERFDAEGHPRGLTTLHPIAAGDMYGVKGMDWIAQDGLLARILAGSYPSGRRRILPMPEIWKMIVEDGWRPTTCPRASCSTCTARRRRAARAC